MSDLLKKLVTISNLDAAWQRVLANGGCRGSDGINLQRFGFDLIGNLRDLSHSLEHGYYHPYPLLRFPVPKRSTVGQFDGSTVAPLDRSTVKLSNGQTVQPSHRFLSVPTVRDRVAQTAAFLVTKEIFEAEFEDVSHGYREGRGQIKSKHQTPKSKQQIGVKTMNTQKPFDLKERTFQFALAVLNWVEKCPRTPLSTDMIRQLIDAGTSVGANTEEAEYAQSPRDEASKLGIALKETAETHYWIRIFKAKYHVDYGVDLLLAEAEELKKIFKSRIRNLRSSNEDP